VRIRSSRMLHANVFHELQPIGGLEATGPSMSAAAAFESSPAAPAQAATAAAQATARRAADTRDGSEIAAKQRLELM
jgi:hypothetical protein